MKEIRCEELQLFDPGPATAREIETKALEQPVWSEHKADLIAKYLRFFIFITHHGTYIDGFAGPQTDKSTNVWTAEKVLGIQPEWLRHFHLFDSSPSQIAKLEALKAKHPERDITVTHGDANKTIPQALPSGSIAETEATFCLLDQRTFECEWRTCEYLAGLRPGNRKVEQFYFLANGWMERAAAGVTTPEGDQRASRWADTSDWRSVTDLSREERRQYFVDKFRGELGYRSVKPWPIYEREGSGKVMYYMIHATDHEEAPKLMYRAYRQAVNPPEEPEKLELMLGDVTLEGY